MRHAGSMDIGGRDRGGGRATSWAVWAVWVALALTLVMNGLASWLPLAGRTTGEIADRFPVMITPAGYAFSIWGLIYAGLLAFAVYQTLPRARGNAAVADVRLPFVATCLFNAGWLVAWHNLWITTSMAFMVALWIMLALIHARLRGLGATGPAGARWFVRVPFGLYFGWITVAALVNLRVLTYAWGWSGGGTLEVMWTLATLVLVTAVAVGIVMRAHDLAFGGVAAWALVGVAVANGGARPLVAGVALAGAVLVLAAALWRGAQRMPRARQTASNRPR